MNILIAEHEPALALFLERSLAKDGHTLATVSDGAAAAAALARSDFDLLLLDLELPEGTGMRMIQIARQLGNGARILVLSSNAGDLETRVSCLDAGADDCMPKPLALRELKARCRALMRRQERGAVLRCGELQLNRIEQSLEWNDSPIALSRREFGLLEFLMLHRGQCVSRTALLEHVWGTSEGGNTNVVDVYVNYLRRKLGEAATLIETVRGQGYRIATVESLPAMDGMLLPLPVCAPPAVLAPPIYAPIA